MNLTKEDLSQRLTQLDDEFHKQGLPLRYRPLKCFKTIHGSVQDDALRMSLLNPIASWFGAKYGKGAIWDEVIGRVPILIRGNVYLLALPCQTGTTLVKLTDQIENLPDSIKSSLTREEFEPLARKASGAFLSYHHLYNLAVDDSFLDDLERDLVWRALFDLETAATSLKHTGDTQSAIFHAHAAAEKFLKVGLKRCGDKTDPKSLGHGLMKIFSKLAALRSHYSWLKSSVDALQGFAPDMDIRYRSLPRSVENAILAFDASLSICGTFGQIWIFDMARGTEKPRFDVGKFYRDGSRTKFYCNRFESTNDGRRVAVLTRFVEFPDPIGPTMMEIALDLDQSALYLELKNPDEIKRVRSLYEFWLRNRGKEVSPEVAGVKVTSGPEGSYTTGMITVNITKRK